MMHNQQQAFMDSPIGILKLTAADNVLVAIEFYESRGDEDLESPTNPILKSTKDQLSEYFEGIRKTFDLRLHPRGTDFERSVWSELEKVSCGSTVTYSEVAKMLGDIKKVRAVGKANGQNPIPIIIPCHRVIGANNKLTGYAGGIERKRWLLQHEGALLL
jgi:methylated-DNA-[protein]-cysteine S-methyltransferase